MGYGYEEKILEINAKVWKRFEAAAKKSGLKSWEWVNGPGRKRFDKALEKEIRKFYKKLTDAEKWKFIKSLENENFHDIAAKLWAELKGLEATA